MYQAAVCDGTDIEWHCVVCEHPDAESTMEDVSLHDTESTRVEDVSHTDPSHYSTEESSLKSPTPTEQSSSFAVTYKIVQQNSRRGRPNLIDSQGYSYSIQRQRGLVTDWQSSVHPKSIHVGPQFGSAVISLNAATMSITTRHKLGC